MLSDAERRVLAIYCFDHPAATCEDCRRSYKFSELGIDIIGRRYHFCPFCRLDMTDQLRLHVLGCKAIAVAVDERIERSRQLIKDSDRLTTASAILAAESHDLARRVLETKRGHTT